MREPFTQHGGAVDSILTDPERGVVISGDRRDRILVWELETGAIRFAIHLGTSVGAMLLERKTGHLIGTGGYSQSLAAAWDLETGEPLGSFDGHRLGVEGLALSPDGSRLATASRDGELRVWSATPVAGARHADLGLGCRASAISTDGHRAIACAADQRLRLLDLDTFEEVEVLELEPENYAERAALAGDRALLALWDGRLRAVDLSSGQTTAEVRITSERQPPWRSA